MWKRASRSGTPTASDDEHEARLLHLASDGDLHAFELLYRRYFPRLMRFLDRAIRRPSLCEEVVNDTMLAVWNSAGRYDGSCKLSTWIFAIAWRKAMKALRAFDDPIDHDVELMPDDSRDEPEEAAQRQELRQRLEQALSCLPFEQRAVVCLTYFHGLDYHEIAAIMECPVNTVKSRMFHGRRKLEVLLGDRAEAR
ncbi:RNA polymerase sigma factor [Noviherbaspirillum pedocola]|uniref:Sigma-70 family RNA polymerase sigma factor n=1 Tax=Noviherbaspirillum pedocola TaxID=2801341 RepID=A0A934T3I0_9BURK|nr:sigma-70 family RNA polymerase sigma factor [Noviherbaspirillum pedocola]MBK4738944.1 sigma-70 family RNA polymerase sigma factor [Noviherbaspirillum pedocola]